MKLHLQRAANVTIWRTNWRWWSRLTQQFWSKKQQLHERYVEYFFISDVVSCPIWYYLYNLKNVKKTHGGVFLDSQKLISLWLWNFQTFNLFLLAMFCKSLSVITCVDHFLLQICRRCVEKFLFILRFFGG